jgi:hypothetical protein
LKTATSKLNNYTLLIEKAQEDIRELIKQAFFNYEPFYLTQVKLYKLIDNAIKSIKIARLKQDAYNSLIRFANVQKNIWQSIGLAPFVIRYIGAQASKDFKPTISSTKTEKAVVRAILAPKVTPTSSAIRKDLSYRTFDKGVPLAQFYKEVWQDQIKPRLDNLVQTIALDPNDLTGRNSLRNLAEMEVRYQEHKDNINDLRNKGVKIVICSAHEDCSERCYPWQKQRFFSLDGTYGEIDGHKYIPLEVATDVWYTTKIGRRYKNGLLGFNCRHKLYEYTGQLTPTVSAKVRKEEYGITLKQRALERAVRRKKIEAEVLKGINETAYKQAKAEAKRLIKEYESYSRSKSRAFYPMRLVVK